jgi:hypothetical protein
MIRKIVLGLFFFGICQLVATDKYDTALGIHLGSSTGSGYSLRKWYNNWGIQGTLAAYTSDNGKPQFSHYTSFPKTYGKRTVIMGLSYLNSLLMTEKTNFYLIAGGSYWIRRERIFEDENASKWEDRDRWNIGVGPGFEFHFSDHFHFSIEFPMTVNYKDDTTDTSMFSPAGGIYYYFK